MGWGPRLPTPGSRAPCRPLAEGDTGLTPSDTICEPWAAAGRGETRSSPLPPTPWMDRGLLAEAGEQEPRTLRRCRRGPRGSWGERRGCGSAPLPTIRLGPDPRPAGFRSARGGAARPGRCPPASRGAAIRSGGARGGARRRRRRGAAGAAGTGQGDGRRSGSGSCPVGSADPHPLTALPGSPVPSPTPRAETWAAHHTARRRRRPRSGLQAGPGRVSGQCPHPARFPAEPHPAGDFLLELEVKVWVGTGPPGCGERVFGGIALGPQSRAGGNGT